MSKQEIDWKDPKYFWSIFFLGVGVLWIATSPLRENCQSAKQEVKDELAAMERRLLDGSSQGIQQVQAVRVYDAEKKRDRLCEQKSTR
jgi:hypothetical protein